MSKRFKKYEIEKNRHTLPLFQRFGITFKNKIEVECYFDESALIVVEGNDKYDLNKLFGFSNCINHHEQSARVGWRCLDGETIELHTYVYNRGVRVKEKLLGIVEPYQLFSLSITDVGYAYHFTINIEDDYINHITENKPINNNLFYFKLFPYFGGNQTAPHDLSIYLRFL